MPEAVASPPPPRTVSAVALALAGVSALLASTCCVAPLALAVIGVSGAWISQLRVLAPYSTALICMALSLLGVVAWQLHRSTSAGGSACHANGMNCSPTHNASRRWFWLVVVLTLIPVIVPLLAPLFY